MNIRQIILALALGAMTLHTTIAAADDTAANPEDFRVYWKSGLNLKSADKQFHLKIGGRVMNDWAWYVKEDAFDSADGTEFRRARLYASGTIYQRVIYKLQMDFASSSMFKDAYVGLKKIPGLGTLKIGHHKEPFSLEELTSSKYIALMERSLPTALAPSRNTGLSFANHILDNQMTWALGVFRDANGVGKGTGAKNYAITGRLTGLPWRNDNGLIHLGAAASWRKVGDTLDYGVRPESHLADKYLKSGDIMNVDQMILYGGEFAAVYDAAHISAEYIGAFYNALTDTTVGGFSVQAGWFLTGESRPYKAKNGTFSRVKPQHNAFVDGGAGAWEIIARVSQLDFSDVPSSSAKMLDVSGGVNWYLNPNARVMIDYVMANPDGSKAGHILQTRFQVDF